MRRSRSIVAAVWLAALATATVLALGGNALAGGHEGTRPFSAAVEKDLAVLQRYIVDRTVQSMKDNPRAGNKVWYLSGPISSGGLGSVASNLSYGWNIAARLRKNGRVVISPFDIEGSLRLPKGSKASAHVSAAEVQEALKYSATWSHAVYMELWSRVLRDPKIKPHLAGMIRLPSSRSSTGALQETGWFRRWNKPIYTFNEKGLGRYRAQKMPYNSTLSLVEHTLLKPGVSKETVRREARWARKKGARAVVVRPENVQTIAKVLKQSKTFAASVIGFPTQKFTKAGKDWARVPTKTKINDAYTAIHGAHAGGATALELDMIMDVHKLKEARRAELRGEKKRASGLYGTVTRDINAVVRAAQERGKDLGISVNVKVIVETSQLTKPELKRAASIVRRTGAFAIKTSTGYGPRGASNADIRIMRREVGNAKLIKASGGIDGAKLKTMRRLGAHVYGMSGTRDLARELRGRPVPRRARRSTGGY